MILIWLHFSCYAIFTVVTFVAVAVSVAVCCALHICMLEYASVRKRIEYVSST